MTTEIQQPEVKKCVCGIGGLLGRHHNTDRYGEFEGSMFGKTELEWQQQDEEKDKANIVRLAKEGVDVITTLQVWLDVKRGEVHKPDINRAQALQDVNEMITLILYTRKAMELSSFLQNRIVVEVRRH